MCNSFWIALQPCNTLNLSATLFWLLLLPFTNPHTQAKAWEPRLMKPLHGTKTILLTPNCHSLEKIYLTSHAIVCTLQLHAYFPQFPQLEAQSSTVQPSHTCSSLILQLSEPCTSTAAWIPFLFQHSCHLHISEVCKFDTKTDAWQVLTKPF